MNDESLVKRATNGLKVQGSMFIQSRIQSQICPHPALLYCSISTPSAARNEYLGCVGCWLLRCLVTQFSEPAGFLVNKSTAWSCQPCLCGWWEVIGPWIAMIGCWKWRLVINADTQKLCTISYLFCCCDLVLIQYSLDTDRNCHTGYTSLGFSVLCLVPSLWRLAHSSTSKKYLLSISLSAAEQWLLLVPRIQTFINRNMRDVPVLLSTHLGHGTQTIVVLSVHLHFWCMSQIDHNMHITTLSPLTPSADANHYCKLQFSYSQQTPSQSQSECTELQDGWCVLSARCVVLAGAGQCLMITICLSPLLVCSRLTWQPGHCTGHPPVLLI